MIHLVLVNPNTNSATTAAMVAIAAAEAGTTATISGMTAPFGAPLIINEATLAKAADAVLALAADLKARAGNGVIVSAFGDPGLLPLRSRLAVPVTGIAEAAMAEAAQDGRRFCVVTTTPDLVAAIASAAAAYGHAAHFAGTWLTPGAASDLMDDPGRLVDALAEACRRAVHDAGADAIVIGGGPLATAARAIRHMVEIPLVEPVPSAVRLAMLRAAPQGESRQETAK